jgi:hypothetical protein
MTLKRKGNLKQQQSEQDATETKKFLMIVVIATLALMVLMYLILG